eukprot:c27397_g1_i3 orf=617-2101(-)
MGSCMSVDETTGEIKCGPAVRARRIERKRRIMGILDAEAKNAELLSRIPGRLCSNGASSIGCIFTQQGRKGTNQDAMLLWENFASRTDAVFCGIFDGHGPYGHLVARKVRDSLPPMLMSHWRARMNGDGANTGVSLEDEDWKEFASEGIDAKLPEMFKAWMFSFLKAYNAMDKELKAHPTLDCFCSGTTAVTMLLQGQDLIIGNVGDSRAVLGTEADDKTLEAVQLTVDLKPNLPKEAERIKQCKGRVFALQDEPEVARLWLPYDDSPGLAMARAFGDFCLKDFGLIAVPEISYRRLTARDQFIVLATDGVWDVVSNKEAIDVISSAPTKTTAARSLVETAVRAWKLKYPTSKVDDCAVVCLYLNWMSLPSVEVNPEIENKDPLDAKDAAEMEPSVGALVVDGIHTATNPKRGEANTAVSGVNLVNEIVERLDESTKEKATERSRSYHSLGDCLSTADDDEWSALEGVTRVNSLLNLPRFMAGDKTVEGIKRKP